VEDLENKKNGKHAGGASAERKRAGICKYYRLKTRKENREGRNDRTARIATVLFCNKPPG